MASLLAVAFALLPLVYLALLLDYGTTFLLRRQPRARSPWLWAGLAVHAAALVLWSVHHHRPPLARNEEILSVLALATAGVYAFVEMTSRDRRTGVFVLVLVLLFQYASSILQAGTFAEAPAAPLGGGSSVWSRLHVVPALVAYTALGFAAVYGVLYLLAQRELHGGRFGVLFDRLPPLESLGRMTWHVLLVGFVAITAAIAVTPFMFGGGDGGANVSDPKIVAKIITGSVAWLLYAAAVLGRWIGKWSPARVAWVAVAGFVAVVALLATSALLSA